MKLDTIVALVILLLNIGTFAGVALLCFMLLRLAELKDKVDLHMPKNPLLKRPPKKHHVIKRTEEQEAKREDEKKNKATWG